MLPITRPAMSKPEWQRELHQASDANNLLSRYEHEDRYHDALNHQAESLLLELKPGVNNVTSYQFQVLVRFLLWQKDVQAKRAMKSGVLKMSKLTIVDSERGG